MKARRTFSQKAAQALMLAGILAIVPSVITLIWPVIFTIALVVSFKFNEAMIPAIPGAIFSVGMVLFVGYVKHAGGHLSAEKIVPLWVGTIAYNALLLIPVVIGYMTWHPNRDYYRPDEYVMSNIFWGTLMILWSSAILLSVGALISVRRDQKYL